MVYDTRSIGSKNSGSKKYRVVSNGSDVDESLFGGNDRKAKSRTSSKSKLNHSSIISSRELVTIKENAALNPKREDDEYLQRLIAEREAAARARKLRMIDMKEKSMMSSQDSDFTNFDTKNSIEKMDKNNDLVKLLNSLGSQAIAFTVRDRQLEEKSFKAKKERDLEMKLDANMEIERLKALKISEGVEKANFQKRIEGRQVIMEQMERRERVKLLELEAREQEGKAMQNVAKKIEEDEKEAAIRRELEVKRARMMIIEANEAAVRARQAAHEMEKKEIEKILIYQAQKDEEMRQRELAEAARKKAMTERQQKLLDGQQRDIDKRIEKDELRARRSAEEMERREREREHELAKKRHNDLKQLQFDRMQQAQFKKIQKALEAEIDRKEYEKAVMYNNESRNCLFDDQESKRAAALQHRDLILAQVKEVEEKKKLEHAAKFEEGRRLKQTALLESAKLKKTRDEMVEDMKNKGINPKYLSEMCAVDVSKMYKY